MPKPVLPSSDWLGVFGYSKVENDLQTGLRSSRESRRVSRKDYSVARTRTERRLGINDRMMPLLILR